MSKMLSYSQMPFCFLSYGRSMWLPLAWSPRLSTTQYQSWHSTPSSGQRWLMTPATRSWLAQRTCSWISPMSRRQLWAPRHQRKNSVVRLVSFVTALFLHFLHSYAKLQSQYYVIKLNSCLFVYVITIMFLCANCICTDFLFQEWILRWRLCTNQWSVSGKRVALSQRTSPTHTNRWRMSATPEQK